MSELLAGINTVLWPEPWIMTIVATAAVFTIWSGFSQYRALTHGVKVLGGAYDDASHPGAISHFQALSAALSGTVGLGNIGGVALAISLGGPGAIFWMWIIGVLGMAVKMLEVTLSMLYRNTDDPENPHGGPMWVADKAFAQWNPKLAGLGRVVAVVFCVSLITATCTGGNMFQAWNVGEVTREYFPVPTWVSGSVLSILVAAVIIGGIRRIGRVAGTLVPFMCALYLLAGTCLLIVNADQIPAMFSLIFRGAFAPTDAAGAFVGGTAASAFLFGMKRAIFSSEVGIGTSPMAHSAARTDEPVREGIVAGLEPFIDTIVVCTLTALIILSTGVWNRAPDVALDSPPGIAADEAGWRIEDTPLSGDVWQAGETVVLIVSTGGRETGNRAVSTRVAENARGLVANWPPIESPTRPVIAENGLYRNYVGTTLTAKAFDTLVPGLGKWFLTIAAWLFAYSTIVT
ncbi:MAG: amino acid carrier protein, partial [Proteobacteria bacterium]|nr:amino acid carrier protein [Pseudomonadota bacterium]